MLSSVMAGVLCSPWTAGLSISLGAPSELEGEEGRWMMGSMGQSSGERQGQGFLAVGHSKILW